MPKYFLVLLFFVLYHSICGQAFDKSKLDSLMRHIDAHNKGMFSLSIFENGQEAYQNAVGYSAVEEEIKANAATKYRIGSITKTFTATIIMKLIEHGQIALDTKLSDFFPAIVNAEKITLEHLLRHRSGIFNFTNAPDYRSYMLKPISPAELIEKIKENGAVFEPDSKAEYSNSNYVLLSQIAEKVTQKKYPDLIQELVCQPCGLIKTGYGDKINTANNEALSYRWLRGWKLARETDLSVPSGAGAIVSTPTELNTFLSCLFDGKIINGSSLSSMKKIVDRFGIGMFKVPFYEKSGFGHSGNIDGFNAHAFYMPEEKVSVAITANGTVMPLNQIIIGALGIYFGRNYEFPEFSEAITLKAKDLEIYLGTYANDAFPLKLTIFKRKNTLFGQATGQSEFPMEALGEHRFRFEPAGLKITFNPSQEQLSLQQAGNTFKLQKE